jgi:hypothetical protein
MSNITSNVNETNQEILNNIQDLQKTEHELFNSLETNPNLTTQQKNEITKKIDQLTKMRISLYQTLNQVNGYFQNALKSSHGTLNDQSTAIQIVEKELNKMKENLNLLQTEKNNKMRLIGINKYYGDKYSEHSSLMKIIIFTLVPVIILTIINRTGILPSIVYYILLCIIVGVGAYYFWTIYASIISRDPLNYNEYDWFFNAGSAPGPPTGDPTDPWASALGAGICIGEACCTPDQTYDTKMDKCITKNSKLATLSPAPLK